MNFFAALLPIISALTPFSPIESAPKYIPDSEVVYTRIEDPGLSEFSKTDLCLEYRMPFFSKVAIALPICLSGMCFGNLAAMLIMFGSTSLKLQNSIGCRFGSFSYFDFDNPLSSGIKSSF